MMKKPLHIKGRPSVQKRDRSSLQKRKPAQPLESLENIVGHRISHGWKEGNEPVTQWNAIILYQVPTIPSLYLVKYDGIDCVYGLELYSDERILNLKILPNKVSFPLVTDTHFTNTIVGRKVIHTFEGKNGSEVEWRGTVLEEAPIMKTWFYITYGEDPVLYIYQLLDDYIEGNLHIMPECPHGEMTSEDDNDVLTGRCVNYNQRKGKVIYQVPTKPSWCFIKFDNDFHIYVYELEKNTLNENSSIQRYLRFLNNTGIFSNRICLDLK